jgi:hypothetical protein
MTNAEIVAERLRYLADTNGGRLTPEMVVADARDESSPLHEAGGFTWDLAKAAERAWLDHARRLIRSVRIVITTETRTIQSIAYVRDPSCAADQQGYVSVSKIRTDRDVAAEAMREEVTRAIASATRAAELAVSLGFEFEVEPILAALQKASERLQAQEEAA